MYNLLSDAAVRDLRQMRRDLTTVQNRLRRLGVSGPRNQQQKYAEIISYNGSISGYDATEVIFGGGGPDDWSTMEGGRYWGDVADNSDAIGPLYAIDSDEQGATGVHPVYRFSSDQGSNWGFVVGDIDDFWITFRHSIEDGTTLRFNDGTVFFNDRVSDEVTDGGGFPLSDDGYYYVEWDMDAGSYTHTTESFIQYSASEPDFWSDDELGTVTVKWKIAEVWSGEVYQEWEGNINGPGSGMPEYTDMSTGDDPSIGRYAGIKDASDNFDTVNHEAFLEIVESKDKYVQGIQYEHTEGDTYKFGGLTVDQVDNYVADIDGETDDQIDFNFNQYDYNTKAGLMDSNWIYTDESTFTIDFNAWLGTDPGAGGATIKHKESPVDSTSHPDHWSRLYWDGTDWYVDGVLATTLTLDFDILGHLALIDDDGPPPEGVNYRYTPCPDSVSAFNIVLDTQYDVVSYNGSCFEFDGTTTDDDDGLTIEGDFTNCADCDSSGGELWLFCSNDQSAAVLSPGHTDVDYAWLCISGQYEKCYDGGFPDYGAANDPTVLKQCGVATPTSCNDLVGWPGSDNYGGAGCNSGSVGDDNFDTRWAAGGATGSSTIAGGKHVVSLNGDNTYRFFAHTNQVPSFAGDYDVSVDLTSLANPNGRFYYELSNNLVLVQYEQRTGTNDYWYNIDYLGGAALDESFSTPVTSTSFRIQRLSGITRVWIGGVLKFISGSNTNNVSGFNYKVGVEDTGTTASCSFDNFVLEDGTSGDIYIDPTGDSC